MTRLSSTQRDLLQRMYDGANLEARHYTSSDRDEFSRGRLWINSPTTDKAVTVVATRTIASLFERELIEIDTEKQAMAPRVYFKLSRPGIAVLENYNAADTISATDIAYKQSILEEIRGRITALETAHKQLASGVRIEWSLETIEAQGHLLRANAQDLRTLLKRHPALGRP